MRVVSNLNVRHSHQSQQLLALVIMLLGDFDQTLGEFINIFLLPWVERKQIESILIHNQVKCFYNLYYIKKTDYTGQYIQSGIAHDYC